MKNFKIFKSGFYEKLKFLVIPMMLLTLGVGQMWGKTIYLKPFSSWSTDGDKPALCYGYDNSSDQTFVAMTQIAGTSWYSAEVPESASSKNIYFMRVTSGWKPSDKWTNKHNGFGWFSYGNGDHYNGTNWDAGEKLDAGFESSLNGIKYYKNSDANDTEWSFNGQAARTQALGAVTNLYLKQWFTYEYENCDVWSATDDGSHNTWKGIGATVMKYNVHRTAVSAGEYTSISKNWTTNFDWDGGYKKSKAGNNNINSGGINLLSGLGSGLYTMSFYYYDPDIMHTSSTHTLTWTIAVPSMATHTHSSDGTGSGTSGSPYLKGVGNTLRITVAGTQSSSDANSVLYVSFDGGDTYSTTNYIDIAISNTTKSSVAIKAKYYNSADDLSGTVYDFGDVYYQGTVTPSLDWAASDPVTPTTMVSGNDVTLSVVRANTSNTITWEYTTDNGSNWSSLTPNSTSNSGQTAVWTIPEAHGATQTYKFRAKITSDDLTTAKSTGVTVYGKKTIHVKNTDNWATFKSYVYNYSAGAETGHREDWPGSTTGITSMGGQWKNVVLTSEFTYFILNDGSSTNQLKGETYTYASSVSDNGYYVIGGSGNTHTLSSSSAPTAPAAPSVSAATSLTNTTATINGSISATNGNDALTDYGFYWSNNGSYDTADKLKASGTKVQKGTSNFSGSISANLTSLTAGNTIRYITYATNGQGTTLSSVQSFVVPYSVQVQKPTGCSSITPGAGNYYYSTGFTVTTVAATGYTFSSWSATNGSTSSAASPSAGTNTVTFTPSANSAVIKPVYTENSYSVTVSNDGHGTVSPTGTVSVKQVTGTSLTASPSSNYVFKDWTISGGGITPSSSTSATQVFKATTTGGTIRANFADQWNVKGSWDSWAAYEPMPATGVANTFGTTMTLAAKTEYHFKVVKRVDNNGSNDKWYGVNGGKTLTRASGSVTGLEENGDVDEYITFTTDAAGDYTITYLYNASVGSMKVTVGYPTAYTMTFAPKSFYIGAGGVTSSTGGTLTAKDQTNASLSTGNKVKDGGSAIFTATKKTGYTFNGFFSNEACTTAYSAGAGVAISDNVLTLSSIGADKYVYAKFSENITTVNLVASPTGKGSFTKGGDAVTSVSAGVTTKPTVTAVAGTGYRLTGTIWSESSDYISLSTETGTSTTITATGTTGNTATLTATFTPITYTIAFNANGGSGTMTSQTGVTYDAATAIKSNTFTRTGYNFAGWATSAGGDVVRADGAAHGNLSNTQGATVTLFAQWTPKQSALTLDYQDEVEGYASDGSISNTEGLKGTYGSAMTALTGTMPTADPGYAFMGFYDATGGGGTKYYNADGSSAVTWDKDTEDGTTLYAHWVKAEFTELEHNASVAKADVAYLVVNPVLNVTPTDYTAICWTLHYKENDNEVATSGTNYYSVAAYTEGDTKPNQVRFTLNNLSVGSYYVKAVLKAKASAFSSVCSEGTRQDSINGDFSIIGSSTVTVRYMDDSGNVIASSGSVVIEAGGDADVVAPDIIGYTFDSWSVGAGVTNNGEDGNTINISAPFDGVIIAFYTKKNMIYFNNTLGWEDVYVYFYSSDDYWDGYMGSGAAKEYEKNSKKAYYREYHGHMTQIEGTNIWYYDYEADWGASDGGEIKGYDDVVFTEANQHGNNNFYATKACRRGDFKHSLSMFVPLDVVTNDLNSTKYYNNGYWMNYPDNSGYKLEIYANNTSGALTKEIEFPFAAGKKMPMSITTYLDGNHTYGFKIYRADGDVFGNNGTMSNGHSGDGNQGVWEFKTGKNKAGLTTTSAGNYTFTLNYGLDIQETPEYNYLVGVRFPESTGDYRVQYKDNVRVTNHSSDEGKSWLSSVVIPAVTERDTVSYFIRKDESPYIRVQKCTANWNGSATTVSWDLENSGNNILTSSLLTSITEDGVYNFIFTKSEGALVLEKIEPYTGNFYIRGAGDVGWDSYRTADHIMPFSEYSFNQTTNPYSHYYTKYYRTKTDQGADLDPIDITFVVANDYSVNISDTITTDDTENYYVNASGVLSGHNANIRFMYNYKTNVATRRYLDDAQGPRSTDFLLLIPSNNTSIYNAQTEGSAYTQVQLTDKGNWVYEANVFVVPGTTYKVRAKFGADEHLLTQYLKGKESGAGEYETLIGGSGSRLKIRLIYDYKTNRVIAAYLPSNGDEISGNNAINADIMFERVHQGNVTQITFETNESQISAIQNVYSTLKFEKDEINNHYLSRYERDLFYVSFPYDVRVSDIIGFGEYGKHWIIEYYDGAARAEKGFWVDSKSFWTFVTPDKASSFIMKAGTGYIVALDLDEMEEDDDVWANTSTVELIFPGDISSISNQEVIYNMPSHQCNINRGTLTGDRRIADSHWNVLGVPAYHNTTGTFENHTDDLGGGKSQVWSADNAPKFLYTWNMTDNSLTPTNASGYNYKAMHAYIVQYYGDVTFHTSTNAAPASVAARTYADAPRSVDFRLEIQQNETAVDQTFVQLSDEEGVSSEFVFGEDMSKEFNKNKANIYTMITSVLNDTATVTEAAGNTLPMSEQTTVVPVGVKIATDGEYTFAIPEGTGGIGVVLVDNVADTRTNLSLTDYTVTLSTGTIDGRFVLEISPVQGTTTSLEPISDEGLEISGVRKVIIDQKMYIIKGNHIYDATGALVK